MGAYLLVDFAKAKEKMLTARRIVEYLEKYTFIVYIVIELSIFLFLVYLHHFKEDKMTVVTILLQVALLGSVTVISAKAVSSMLTLTFSGHSQMAHPVFYIMLVILVASAVGQMRYLNQAMASYDATVVMPINFILFSFLAMLSGVVFYQEFWALTFIQVIMTLLGAFLCFGGVFLISGGREADDGEECDSLLKNDENDEKDGIPLDPIEAAESKAPPDNN